MNTALDYTKCKEVSLRVNSLCDFHVNLRESSNDRRGMREAFAYLAGYSPSERKARSVWGKA